MARQGPPKWAPECLTSLVRQRRSRRPWGRAGRTARDRPPRSAGSPQGNGGTGNGPSRRDPELFQNQLRSDAKEKRGRTGKTENARNLQNRPRPSKATVGRTDTERVCRWRPALPEAASSSGEKRRWGSRDTARREAPPARRGSSQTEPPSHAGDVGGAGGRVTAVHTTPKLARGRAARVNAAGRSLVSGEHARRKERASTTAVNKQRGARFRGRG